MTGTTVAIIQARMGSSRFPGKVLEDIAGEPMLDHVVRRTRVASLLDTTVVATTTESQDDRIVEYCERAGVPYTRGSEPDVLDRYYRGAQRFDADTVVRITADCPLVDPAILDRLIRRYHESGVDYVSNKHKLTYPLGLQAEVLSLSTLERMWNEATRPEDREHVTRYVRRSSEFRKQHVENRLDTAQFRATRDDAVLRWIVDYPADIAFVRAIHERLGTDQQWLPSRLAVWEVLERHPDLPEEANYTPIDTLGLD
jgi:spore coat polysaccharide biosynthesis protein SpsF (cytidylyltransferase family)